MLNFGGSQKVKTKVEKKQEEEMKTKVKLEGDLGYNCNYYNGHNHLAKGCMLRKKEEKKAKVKDEAYYAKRLEEVHDQTKNHSLMDKGGDDSDTNYQIWSSGYDDEEIRHPTHGVLFEKYEEGGFGEKSLFGKDVIDNDEELEENVKDEESDGDDVDTIGR